MKKFLVIALLLISTTVAFAQTTKQIKDYTSGHPATNADLLLLQRGVGGYFKLDIDDLSTYVAGTSAISSVLSTYQPLDTELTALATIVSSANSIPYFSGSGTAGIVSIGSGLTFTGGTLAASGGGGATTITATSANALAVGQAGTTNPIFNVDTATASAVTGIKLTGGAAGTPPTITTLSTNGTENLDVSSKGGYLRLQPSGYGVNYAPSGTTRAVFEPHRTTFSPATDNGATTARLGYTAAANTSLTAATEFSQVLFNMSATQQHASNTAITTQRDFRIQPAAHSFASATGTITDHYGLSVDAPPSAGTNAVVTRAWSAGFGGNIQVSGNVGTANICSTTNTNCKTQASLVNNREYCYALSDQTTDLTTGTAKATAFFPSATVTVNSVRAYTNTAPTGSTIIVDINEAGSTLMTTTKLSIDASEKTSGTAAAAAVLTDTSLASDAEITFDIDQVGSTIKGKGLVVCLNVSY